MTGYGGVDVCKCVVVVFPAGEATLTDALTAAGKTYEEIAQMVAEQVGCSSHS